MSNRPKIYLIAMIDINGIYVVGNNLPFRIPENMKHFKETTTGKTVIMGRKTLESLPTKWRVDGLPNRANIVISSRGEIPGISKDIIVAKSLKSALSIAATSWPHEIFLIGGKFIWEEALKSKIVDGLYVTHVQKEAQGVERLSCEMLLPKNLSQDFSRINAKHLTTEHGKKIVIYRFEKRDSKWGEGL